MVLIRNCILVITLIRLLLFSATAQTITAGEYFFDTDPGVGLATSLNINSSDSINSFFSISSTGLSPGFHQLFIRFKQEYRWSIAESRSFYISEIENRNTDSITSAEYFIAPDPGPGNGVPFSVKPGVSIDSTFNYIMNLLPFGNYKIGVRFKNVAGSWSFAESRQFKICKTYGPEANFELVKDGNKVSVLNRSKYDTANKWVLNNGDTISSKNYYQELQAGNYKISLTAMNGCGQDTIAKVFSIEGLKRVFPLSAGNSGKATVHIEGFGFTGGTTFILSKGGVALPADAPIILREDLILAGLYLGKADKGFYKLEVQILDKPLLIIDSAFQVVEGIEPLITVASQIPSIIRTSRPTLLKVLATNTGNIDAYGVPIIISGLPISANIKLMNDTAPTIAGIEYEVGPRVNLNRFEVIDSINGTRMIPVVIPRIGPSETIEILLEFTGKQTGVSFEYVVKSLQPLYKNEINSQQLNKVLGATSLTDCGDNPDGGLGGINECAECLRNTVADKMEFAFKELFSAIADLTPYSSIVGCSIGIYDIASGIYKMQTQEEGCINSGPYFDELSHLPKVQSYTDLIVGGTKTAVDCAAAILSIHPVGLIGATAYRVLKTYDNASKILDISNTGIDAINCLSKDPPCNQPPCPECGSGGTSSVRTSWDPNEKRGPGSSDNSFIRTNRMITYTVSYENAQTAGLPAQTVMIFDTLDVTKFNPKSVTFTSASIGKKSVSLATTDYSTISTIDLRSYVDYLARLNATIDTATGIIQWQVQTIDPATNEEIIDPLAGFLPPNDSSHRGEGTFTYTVKLKDNVKQGDTIKNKASIVFDNNYPIVTNYWVNLFDTEAPISSVQSTPAIVYSDSLLISWGGNDNVSGIDHYNIWVSVNNGPFTPWITGTRTLQDTFAGIYGNTYTFFSCATDKAGNQEILKTNGKATVKLVLLPTIFTFTGNGSYKNPGNWLGNKMPPSVLPTGSEIVINPTGNNTCTLDKIQELALGSKFTVSPNKKLIFLTGMYIKR